jgi:hypothetical protein
VRGLSRSCDLLLLGEGRRSVARAGGSARPGALRHYTTQATSAIWPPQPSADRRCSRAMLRALLALGAVVALGVQAEGAAAVIVGAGATSVPTGKSAPQSPSPSCASALPASHPKVPCLVVPPCSSGAMATASPYTVRRAAGGG